MVRPKWLPPVLSNKYPHFQRFTACLGARSLRVNGSNGRFWGRDGDGDAFYGHCLQRLVKGYHSGVCTPYRALYKVLGLLLQPDQPARRPAPRGHVTVAASNRR